MPATRWSPTATRDKILRAAYLEFYRTGFQGGSLNQIVDAAGITKGALFHHFDGKQSLGYAVVDEIVGPLLVSRWLDRLQDADDPIADTKAAFRKHVKADIESGNWFLGCPLNNLAQEMSPLDEGFRTRIDGLYERWRTALAAAFTNGKKSGTVRSAVTPRAAAALIVASQMGIWGTGKTSRNKTVMLQATDAVCDYLDSLRP